MADLIPAGTSLNAGRSAINQKVADIDRRMDNVIGQTGNSNSEIVDARLPASGTAFATLKKRLDTENKDVRSYIDDRISTIGNASPKGAYATVAALQAAFPTGTTGIYVVSDDGKWYYWSGSTWTSGGQYQSSGIANGAVTPEKTDFAERYKSANLLNPALVLMKTKPVTTTGAAPDQTEAQNSNNTLPYLVNTGSNTYILSLPGASSSLYIRAAVYLPSGYSTNIVPTYNNGVFNFTIPGGYTGFRIFTDSSFTDYANADLMVSSNWKGTHEQYGLETNTIKNLKLPPVKSSDIDASINKLFNPLYAKKIAWFGDSITDVINKTWAYHIPLVNNMDSISYAVAGSAISYLPSGQTTTETNCITKAIETYASSLVGRDYIIFSGGFNDGARGESLYPTGTLTDVIDFTGALDKNTFYGALEQCCRILLKTCLGSKIGFIITPNNPDNTYFRTKKRPAIIATLEKYSIPYIDLFKEGGLTPGITEVNNGGYFQSTNGVGDKTHPSELGYTTYLNPKVTAWLKTL